MFQEQLLSPMPDMAQELDPSTWITWAVQEWNQHLPAVHMIATLQTACIQKTPVSSAEKHVRNDWLLEDE